MDKIKVLSLFSGVGAFEEALKNENIPFELINYCEIDKYASKSYSVMHNISEKLNLWDVKKVDGTKLKNIDLITHGSPCQDFSNAGKGAGGNENDNTRSSLMWETVRIINECKPKYILWEQVLAILQKKHVHNFRKYNIKLTEFGYNTMFKVLNAKDFGLPQNRSRVFVVSIRKDIDNSTFEFPKGCPLKIKLKDLLECNVDKKYFLSEKLINGFIKHSENHKEKGNGFAFELTNINNISKTITTREGTRATDTFIKDTHLEQKGYIINNSQANRVYSENGLSTTLNSNGGGMGAKTGLYIISNTKKGYIEANEGDGIVLNFKGKARGTVQKESIPTLQTSSNIGGGVATNEFAAEKEEDDVITFNFQQSEKFKNKPIKNMVATLKTQSNQAVIINDIESTISDTTKNELKSEFNSLAIRRLTPIECSRLQGFSDLSFFRNYLLDPKINENVDFRSLIQKTSDNQLYKQYGNALPVPIAQSIFRNLFKNKNIIKIRDIVLEQQELF